MVASIRVATGDYVATHFNKCRAATARLVVTHLAVSGPNNYYFTTKRILHHDCIDRDRNRSDHVYNPRPR